MAFTEEQKQAYLASSTKCPSCGSEDLEWELEEFVGDDECKAEVFCRGCAKRFWEYYKLYTIEDGTD